MKPLGGYFELELQKSNQSYHTTKAFKSGRAALHYILKITNAKNVYIPFYTCNALLEPFKAAGVPYQFYSINSKFEPEHLPILKRDEYFLYVNYLDLKRETILQLEATYGEQLIIDNSQAFFYQCTNRSWWFNSCRKFFGVPDGAYVYTPIKNSLNVDFDKNTNYTIEHLLKRFNGDIHGGYTYFQENEIKCNADIKEMSSITEHLLSNIDYDLCIQKRKENYTFLHHELSHLNSFNFVPNAESVPMAYPFLPFKKIEHSRLWNLNLYVPILWKDVIEREEQGFEIEKWLSNNLLPLPIDHRYNIDDMKVIINILKSL